MTKESQSDPELLDELGDDAIVAQQTGAHVPQRRVKVQVESRSVVVSEATPAPDRELEKYDHRSNDPTVVVRDRRKRSQLLDDVDVPFKKKRANWGARVVWLLAAVAAFGVGGLISVIRGSVPAAAPSSAPAVPAPPATTPAAETAAPPSRDIPQEAASAKAQPAVPAVDLDQLPVERRPRVVALPKKTAPASHPAAAAPAPAPAPAPKPAAIPEGI